jgi:NitT/TauT family transport system substrate-binding protein
MRTRQPSFQTRPVLSRRSMLVYTGSLTAATSLGAYGVARALTADFGSGQVTQTTTNFSICRTAAAADGVLPSARQLKLAWDGTAICTASAPVAKERGMFARRNLDVDFVNFRGSTEQLLEAIATGKADAGIGMALRWLKPLEQGFDVRITAGVHGGCLRLLAAKSAGVERIADLRGKSVAVSDQASPAKNFFSIALAKAAVNPEKDVEWRQYPSDLLPLAVEKGEVQALADNDPRTYLWLKDGKLKEVMTNLSGEFANRTCCVLAIRGGLVRTEREVATALTRALLEAGDHVAQNPEDAAAVFSNYGGKGPVADLTAMLKSHTHHDHPIGDALKKQIALYTEELKLVKVIKQGTDPNKFVERVYADVLS